MPIEHSTVPAVKQFSMESDCLTGLFHAENPRILTNIVGETSKYK